MSVQIEQTDVSAFFEFFLLFFARFIGLRVKPILSVTHQISKAGKQRFESSVEVNRAKGFVCFELKKLDDKSCW
jgi:hypothetical protein